MLEGCLRHVSGRGYDNRAVTGSGGLESHRGRRERNVFEEPVGDIIETEAHPAKLRGDRPAVHTNGIWAVAKVRQPAIAARRPAVVNIVVQQHVLVRLPSLKE